MTIATLPRPRINTGRFRFGTRAKRHKSHPAADGLLSFTRHTMPEYEVNWHHAAVCDYLNRFVRREIKRLMVFMPPRHGKSELVSRRLPAYILGLSPEANIIAASYGADLARRMNRDVQRIIDSPRYQEVFPNTRLYGKNIRTVAGGTWLRNSDLFEVVEYGGYYRSAGVGGAITGMGMLYGIVDDPLKNRQEANSLTVRNGIWDWYISTFRTRLAPDGAILLTVTRWHEDDLAGRLLDLAKSDPKADQWTVISFPAVCEDEDNDLDPRQPGEALWPSRFDLDALEATRISIGAYEWASLYQQRPAPREGGMFKFEWFDIVPAVPGGDVRRVRYWDKAGTKDAGAHTAGVKMAMVNGVFYIEDVIMGQWGADEREPIIQQTAALDGVEVVVVVEQEPGSGGKESAENTVRSLPGYVVYTDKVTGDKVLRAEPMAAQAAVRNVKLLKAPWNKRLLDILASFPNGIKDPVDASSGGFNYLTNYDPTGGIHV